MADTPNVDVEQPLKKDNVGKKLQLTDSDEQLVGKAALNLQEEFEAEKGGKIGSFLAGSPEKASEAHNHLFRKTLEQDDPNKRRISNMAHLQLELEYNDAADRIQSAYGQQIGKAGIPLAQVFPGLYRYEGMVPSGTEIAKGHQEQKLIIKRENLAEIYNTFAERYLQYYTALEGRELRDGKSREETAAIAATQEMVLRYFGVPNEHTGGKNRQKYEDQSKRTLQEFAGDKSATCTEIGAFTQDFLSFAGVKTMLISGGPLLVADSEGNYDSPSFEGHVFNVLFLGEKQDRPFLFDPSNFLLVPNDSNPSQMQIQSFLSPLSAEQFDDLRNNRNTEVEFGGEKRLYSLS